MPVTEDGKDFARLMEALHPWLDQVVVIGGWAHRLYRLHPLDQPLHYEPLTTLDADIAVPAQLSVAGQDMHDRLIESGFQEERLGDTRPPAEHYHYHLVSWEAKKPAPKWRRSITRMVDSPETIAFKAKMQSEAAKKIYDQRSQIAEFPHAWIKERCGLRQFAAVDRRRPAWKLGGYVLVTTLSGCSAHVANLRRLFSRPPNVAYAS